MSIPENSPELQPTPNPNGGPNTESGKAISSKNTTTHGLFATTDVIRPGDEPYYHELGELLHSDLAPTGILELNLVEEIHRAMWRLRRCGLVEARLNAKLPNGPDADPDMDPMENETTAKLQASVDRARAQAHRLLHKSTEDLRKLQTERQFRNNYFDPGTDASELGIANFQTVTRNIEARAADKQRREHAVEQAEIDKLLNIQFPPAEPSSFCKTPSTPETPAFQIPRNAQCPCKSGLKYKLCCGKDAPPMLQAA